MRATVQEKLDRTLSERLTASFRTVDEKLGLVQTGLGEMRTMAESVRDLKGILANVKTRGTFGETQLAAILANILTPAQYGAQVRVVPGSREAVDFAVRMPGASGDGPCWLPMDSKFPVEDYARLLDAESRADAAAAAQARVALERAVLVQAKSIHDKYEMCIRDSNMSSSFFHSTNRPANSVYLRKGTSCSRHRFCSSTALFHTKRRHPAA